MIIPQISAENSSHGKEARSIRAAKIARRQKQKLSTFFTLFTHLQRLRLSETL